ncbi:MAG: hypothetical protein RJAPGHWK_002308 [Candidatus Fervidibacter sp.]
MRERREEIHVTIEPKRGYKVLEFFEVNSISHLKGRRCGEPS